jgi:hypothetical protein
MKQTPSIHAHVTDGLHKFYVVIFHKTFFTKLMKDEITGRSNYTIRNFIIRILDTITYSRVLRENLIVANHVNTFNAFIIENGEFILSETLASTY